MKRFAIAMAALLLPLAQPRVRALGSDRVAVVCDCLGDAYKEALDGIRQALGREPEVLPPDAGAAAFITAARQNPGRIYIAVGRDALRYATSVKPGLPVVGTMILRGDAATGGTPLAAEVDLDVPPRLLLQKIHQLFPRASRLGVLVSGNVDRAALVVSARELALSIQLSEVSGPESLLKAFLALKGKADLVVTFPDNTLYNGATVKPLVLASLEERLPIVGFSAAFVHAGAAAGVFADFREAGRQAAEAALRLEPAQSEHTAEPPRKLTVAVNQRVLRLLGLDYHHDEGIVVYR